LSKTLINVPLEILIILEIEIPLTSVVEWREYQRHRGPSSAVICSSRKLVLNCIHSLILPFTKLEVGIDLTSMQIKEQSHNLEALDYHDGSTLRWLTQ
jgi:hypothetical protein